MVQDNGLQKTIQKEADSKTKIQKPADKATTPTWTDAKVAAKESPAFEFLGEYLKDGKAIQVVPAEGRFYLSIYQGGLPGAGWDGEAIEHEWVEPKNIQSRLVGFKKVDRSAKLDFKSPPENAIACLTAPT